MHGTHILVSIQAGENIILGREVLNNKWSQGSHLTFGSSRKYPLSGEILHPIRVESMATLDIDTAEKRIEAMAAQAVG